MFITKSGKQDEIFGRLHAPKKITSCAQHVGGVTGESMFPQLRVFTTAPKDTGKGLVFSLENNRISMFP
jgi:hypothetical protein